MHSTAHSHGAVVPARVPRRAVRVVRRRGVRGARRTRGDLALHPDEAAAWPARWRRCRVGRAVCRGRRPPTSGSRPSAADDARLGTGRYPGRPDRRAGVLAPSPRPRSSPCRRRSRPRHDDHHRHRSWRGPGRLRAPAGPRRAVRRGRRGDRPSRLAARSPTTWSSSSATAPSSPWSAVQDWADDAVQVSSHHARLGRDATLRHHPVDARR